MIEERLRERAGAGTATIERPAAPPAPGVRRDRRARLLRLQPLVGDGLRVPLAIFLLSRVYVLLLGAIAMRIGVTLPQIGALDFYMPELDGLARDLLQPWRNWDGHWYTLIAARGYGYSPVVAAFYPLYPLLLRGGAGLLGGRFELAGVLLSHAAFFCALILLYRLVQLDFPRPVARRTLLYLALFPTSYYFSAVYSESLFLLLSIACFYAARRDRWWLAGACGFLAALTRPHGVLLLLPLVLLFLRQRGRDPRRWWGDWRANPVSLALVPAGLLAYMYALRRLWGNPLLMRDVQGEWERYSANPLDTLREGLRQVDGCALRDKGVGVEFCWVDRLRQAPALDTLRDPQWRWALAESDATELCATVLLLALGLAALRLLPLAYSAYLAAGIILPLWSPSEVHPLMSMHRFALILFPAFIVLALAGRWRPVHAAIVVTFSLLLAFFTIQFASWFWVA